MLLLPSSDNVPKSQNEWDLLLPSVSVAHSSWAGVRELPTALLLENNSFPLQGSQWNCSEPSSATSVLSSDSKALQMQCAVGRGAGTSWGYQEIRSALSPTLEGILVFEEIRLGSRVGTIGEGSLAPLGRESSEPPSSEWARSPLSGLVWPCSISLLSPHYPGALWMWKPFSRPSWCNWMSMWLAPKDENIHSGSTTY